jgi:hypothetical protein
MIKKITPMRLEKLEIERKHWGDDAGKLKGRARFSSKNADVAINLTEGHCQKIIDMCADALLDAAKEMSDVMRNDIIEGISGPEMKRLA